MLPCLTGRKNNGFFETEWRPGWPLNSDLPVSAPKCWDYRGAPPHLARKKLWRIFVHCSQVIANIFLCFPLIFYHCESMWGYVCVGQKTAVRGWFSQSTVGSGNQTQVVWLSRQVLLPAEPAHQPVCLDAHCLAFGLLFCSAFGLPRLDLCY